MIQKTQSPIVMEIVTDPEELAKAKAQDERFERNWAWFTAHSKDAYAQHRGKILCISGEQLFVGDTPEEALELAKSAFPEDDGRFTIIVPKESGFHIYLNRRRLTRLP